MITEIYWMILGFTANLVMETVTLWAPSWGVV